MQDYRPDRPTIHLCLVCVVLLAVSATALGQVPWSNLDSSGNTTLNALPNGTYGSIFLGRTAYANPPNLDIYGNVANNGAVRLKITNGDAHGFADIFMFNDASALYAGFQIGGSQVTSMQFGQVASNMAKFISNAPVFAIGTSSLGGDVILGADDIRRVTISAATGNVGVGVTAPGYPLDVAGTIHASGDVTAGGHIYATYQDLAEYVPAEQLLEPGTVVVIDDRADNHVVASQSAYDTSVAGIVSENPGIALGKPGPSKATIATTGRVRVKVDARSAPIRRGDLLVTSDIAGMAMRSEPITVDGNTFHRPGTIIGKALEPLERGQGQILVLLSLQ